MDPAAAPPAAPSQGLDMDRAYFELPPGYTEEGSDKEDEQYITLDPYAGARGRRSLSNV